MNIIVHDHATAHELLRLKARHGEGGTPYVKAKAGDEFYTAGGEWRVVERKIDRENDLYHERIMNSAGKVVKEVNEPLSKHCGHGSAKPRQS